ncbi:type VI secretion system membrane subunit TssM [Paraburkholderia azotifigens]|uniref:Type VI secretion system membrane subunit TssM n=1 Tax=Paraburkholderia azotifigens TaxID=2057004 RepID=A0A5C6V5H4_9BURK|nr:type VI secretion system membrane subunit TssM [Paraburkholderia azotifigens]TXC80114.1 type VI secretion system membrane subunit TssM [Paraburkholderia azotifigens]
MKKLLSFLSSRWFVALLALLVLALLIWFLGPLIAFGGLKPLASVALRVVVIALLLAGVLLWAAGLTTGLVFGALLCLLIWYAAPLLSFGTSAPFESVAARIIAIALVIACFAAWGIWWLWDRMRSDDDFLKKALAFGSKKEPSPAADRLKDVEARMNGALVRLKAMRTGARGIGRLFQGTRYLYEMPWFLALGSNASGKTTALLNAGLPFPLGTAAQRTAGAIARTRNVDWWLTNDAVLIDTAGHYTRHGSSAPVMSVPAEAPLLPDGKHEVSVAPAAADTRTSPAASTCAAAGTHSVSRESIDAAEWSGFLTLLRKHRPRAPINGALVSINLDVLTAKDPAIRAHEAEMLRTRLAEARAMLGIRFPVYMLITQMDRLPGFADYFSSLTEETRAQIWGFTLPVLDKAAQTDVAARCNGELTQLASRLAGSVNTRLEDEYDPGRRRRLIALPEAFAALAVPLVELLSQLFLNSRYDDTQLHATLRGVYFTSATQGGGAVVAEPLTIIQRLGTGVGKEIVTHPGRADGNLSYFLADLFTRVVIPEAHLVSPNLRWEYRIRALRILGHALATLLFVWLALGLRTSFNHNSDYLDTIQRKTQQLAARVSQLYRDPKPEAVPDTLSEALYLPTLTGLDLADPDGSYRYGLYSAPPVVDAGHDTYLSLENNLLLPHIVHRMEEVISQSMAARDAKGTYDSLRVYLMLYDKAKFNADDVKAWVLDDWAKTDSASIFGGRATMIGHVQQLFSGAHVVQSPLIRNDGLIQGARTFLDSSNATQRLYERAKAVIQKEAPDEFTLLRAVGPQAGTVFTRASGAPLSRGVPGLFTFDGYRNLFDKRLREFAHIAQDDDAWVMGRSYLGEAEKKTADLVSFATGQDDPLAGAIRRLYLTEYAQQWDAFLGDIRTVQGTSLSFNLQVLRQFAAPDSPLARLARAAVRETTITQPTATEGSFLQKTAGKVGQKAGTTPGIRAEERIERELVDTHFAALREVVTGDADVGDADPGSAGAPAGRKDGLDGVSGMLNDYYTALTVADNAISNNSMPPASDIASKLKMAANTMPAPLREVLLGLSVQGSREVNHGIGQLLSRQMQAAVSDTCRLSVEGNYPFDPDSKRDVNIDDFTRVFAQGGVIDDFFTRNLTPFVDTSARPWRYRTLPGASEPVQGPDLEPFEHAKAIRDVFFGDHGKQMLWKADIRVPEIDPTIMTLSIDIDGQSTLYQHGPVAPFSVSWPGPRGGVHTEITASPRIRPETSTIAADGPWALMRLIRKGQAIQTATPGRTRVAYDFDGRKAVLDISNAGSVANPLTSDVLKTFHCPSSVPMISLPDGGPPPGLPAAGMSAGAIDAPRG